MPPHYCNYHTCYLFLLLYHFLRNYHLFRRETHVRLRYIQATSRQIERFRASQITQVRKPNLLSFYHTFRHHCPLFVEWEITNSPKSANSSERTNFATRSPPIYSIIDSCRMKLARISVIRPLWILTFGPRILRRSLTSMFNTIRIEKITRLRRQKFDVLSS